MKRTINILVLGILFLILNSCICRKNFCKFEVTPPTSHLITRDTAVALQKNFFKNQERVREGKLNAISNERSDFWFPSKELSDYICYTQKTAKDNGYEISGYRMYLGAASKSDSTIGKYKLFIVPTIAKNKKNSLIDSKILKTVTFSDKADNESIQNIDDPNCNYYFDISGSGNPRLELK